MKNAINGAAEEVGCIVHIAEHRIKGFIVATHMAIEIEIEIEDQGSQGKNEALISKIVTLPKPLSLSLGFLL